MPKLFFFTWEVEPKTFYLFNNIFDQIFAIMLATFYIFFVTSKETKFFLFIVGLLWLIFSITMLIAFIVDDSFITVYHKRYFQLRMFLAIILLVLFGSSIMGLLMEGLEIMKVFTSIWFLVAMFLLVMVFFWSMEMVNIIRKLRGEEKANQDVDSKRNLPFILKKKEKKNESDLENLSSDQSGIKIWNFFNFNN